MSTPLTVAQVQYLIDKMDVSGLLRFIERSGLREQNGHIYVPKGFTEPQALTKAINYLCDEWDYSAGEQPETEVVVK